MNKRGFKKKHPDWYSRWILSTILNGVIYIKENSEGIEKENIKIEYIFIG